MSFSTSANLVGSAQLTIPCTTTAFIGTYGYGVLQWDFNAMAYAYIPYQSSTATSITVPISDAGIFLFVSYDTTVPITFPSFYAQVLTISSSSTSYSFPNGIFIAVSSSTSNTFSTTFNSQNPKPNNPPSNYTSGNKFVDINLVVQASVNANVSFAYDAANSASSVVIGFYNDTAGVWTFPSVGLSVDANAHVATQTTTHFSTWGVYYSHSSAPQVTVTWIAIVLACALLLL